jgi:hypothetical protein
MAGRQQIGVQCGQGWPWSSREKRPHRQHDVTSPPRSFASRHVSQRSIIFRFFRRYHAVLPHRVDELLFVPVARRVAV